MQNKLRVLMVIDSLKCGGAESLLSSVTREFINHYKVYIEVVALFKNGIVADSISKNGVIIKCFRIKYLIGIPIGAYRLIKLLKSGDFNVVHAHLFHAGIITAIASLFYKKCKYVYTEHNERNRRRDYKIFKFIDKFTYSRFNRIICVSKRVKKALISWSPSTEKKIIVIHNSVLIPENKWSVNSRHSWDLIMVGRLNWAKGVDILLKVVSILKRKRENIKVAILGDGPLRYDLELLAKKLYLDRSVKFLGFRADVANVMLDSLVFVLPSRWEGLPMVILEAMSLGLPVIASDVGGVSEIVKNEANGILIQDIHDFNRVAFTAEGLLADREKMARLGDAARATISNEFFLSQYTNRLLDLYLG